MANWQKVNGRVEQGHQVASGAASNSPYPRGTIAMQIPILTTLGLDLTRFFPGTLNVSIAPNTFAWIKPEFTFRQVQWTDQHPPEDFSFSQCHVIFNNIVYDAFIYYPHPETKTRHFQHASTLEILAPLIPGIQYGEKVEIEFNALEVSINPTP